MEYCNIHGIFLENNTSGLWPNHYRATWVVSRYTTSVCMHGPVCMTSGERVGHSWPHSDRHCQRRLWPHLCKCHPGQSQPHSCECHWGCFWSQLYKLCSGRLQPNLREHCRGWQLCVSIITGACGPTHTSIATNFTGAHTRTCTHTYIFIQLLLFKIRNFVNSHSVTIYYSKPYSIF